MSYGETLLRVARLAWDGAMPAATVGILHWRGKLEDRIAGLIDTKRNKMTRTNPLTATGVTVAFLSVGAIICGTTIVQADQGGNPPAKVDSGNPPHKPDPAPAPPAATETSRAKPTHDKPTPNEEREREKALDALARVYALKPGEVLKCITPPFPSERDAYLNAVYPQIPQAARSLDGYVWMNFTWNDRLKYKNGVVHSAPAGLGRRVLDVLTGSLDCPEQEIEGDQAILTKGIAADFIVRDGASPEQVVARLAEILKEKFKMSVKISIKDEEREVFVVQGKCKSVADRIEVYGYKIIDPSEGGGGEGSFREMLGHVGDWIKCRIVAEVEDAPKQVSWHFNWRPPFTKELLAQDQNPESVMKHLGEQTGLTVSKEARKVRVYQVEATKSE